MPSFPSSSWQGGPQQYQQFAVGNHGFYAGPHVSGHQQAAGQQYYQPVYQHYAPGPAPVQQPAGASAVPASSGGAGPAGQLQIGYAPAQPAKGGN